MQIIPNDETHESQHLQQFKGEWEISFTSDSNIQEISSDYSTILIDENSAKHCLIKTYITPILADYKIDTIHLISSTGTLQAFYKEIKKCEARSTSPSFQLPNDLSLERRSILYSLECHPCLALHNRNVKIMRAWHGTSVAVAHRVMNEGFANLATMDAGWFGKGIYFTTHPKYALKYCENMADPCLVLCYIILFNPYPVVWEDAKSQSDMLLAGKANHQNFGCHYVPVVEYGHQDFRPPGPGRTAKFDEIVIFQESHILPYAMITIREATKEN